MNKFMKGFITAILAVCMIVCLGLAAACTDDKPAEIADTVEVTVQLPDGTPAEDVTVQVCAMNGEVTGCKFPVTTDANGKVSVDVKTYVDGGSTLFEVHLSSLPADCAYLDANGNEYASGTGVELDITKGNSITIKLSEKKTDLPSVTPISFDVTLANTSATKAVVPAIEEDGLYELRSVSKFTLSNSEFSLTEGYNNVLIYLEVGDSLNFGTIESLSYNVTVVAATDNGKDSPISTLTANAAVLKLSENESLNISNPAAATGGTVNSPVIVNGSNYSVTYNGETLNDEFVVAAGKSFTVKAVDASKYVVLNFGSPVSSTTVNVGESKDFEISLINTASGTSEESLQWITSTYYVTFTPSEAGFYRVEVSSEFDDDELYISQIGSSIHYPIASQRSAANGKTYYAVFKLKADETYRAFVSSSSSFDGKSDGDTITYTANVQKVDPVYQTLTLNNNNSASLNKDLAYSYTVPASGNYTVTLSTASEVWYLNGEEYAAESANVAVSEGGAITINTSFDCTVTIVKASELPTYDTRIDVVITNDAPYVYTANVEAAGWYSISSHITKLQITMDGLAGYLSPYSYEVVLYLNPDDIININLEEGTQATLSLNRAVFAGTQADPLQVEDGRIFILNGEETTYYFKNPERTSIGWEGSKLNIFGSNCNITYNEAVQSNYGFVVNVNETFTVNVESGVFAIISAALPPVIGTPETPDEIDSSDASISYNFDIELEEDWMGYMDWPADLYGEYYLSFRYYGASGNVTVTVNWNDGEEISVYLLTDIYGAPINPVSETYAATSYTGTFALEQRTSYFVKLFQEAPADTQESKLSYSLSVVGEATKQNPNVVNVVLTNGSYSYVCNVEEAGWYSVFSEYYKTPFSISGNGFNLRNVEIYSYIMYLTPGETYTIRSADYSQFTMYVNPIIAQVSGDGSAENPFKLDNGTYFILNGTAQTYYFENPEYVYGAATDYQLDGLNATVVLYKQTYNIPDDEVVAEVGAMFTVSATTGSVAVISGIESSNSSSGNITLGETYTFEGTLEEWSGSIYFVANDSGNPDHIANFTTSEAGTYKFTITGHGEDEFNTVICRNGDNVEYFNFSYSDNVYTATVTLQANTAYAIEFLYSGNFTFDATQYHDGDNVTFELLVEKV